MTLLLTRIFLLSTYAFSTLFLFTFLVLPSRSIWSRLHFTETLIDKYQVALVGFSLMAAAVCYLFSRFFDIWNEKATISTPNQSQRSSAAKPRWKLPLFLIIGSILLIRSILGVDRPFDMDELSMVNQLLEGSPMQNLLSDSTHPIASCASRLTTSLFGLSVWSIRLPSLIFAVGFLAVLIRFCLNNLSPLAGTIAIGHLATSSIVVWYFHSARGYASMIFLVFYLFVFIYEVSMTAKEPSRWSWFAFVIALAALPFSHGFAILFGVLLPISLTAWILVNKTTFTQPQRRNIFKINSVLIAFLPYFTLCLGYMFLLLASSSSKYIGMAADSPVSNETPFRAIVGVLGAAHTVSVKILLLGVLLILFNQIAQKRILKDITLFIVTIFVGFIVLQSYLVSSFVMGRFLLGILPLFILWIANSIQRIPNKPVYHATVPLLAISLIVFPAVDGTTTLFQLPQEDFYRFLQTTKKQLKGIPTDCINFSYSGSQPASMEAWFAKQFYFRAVEGGLANIDKRVEKKVGGACPTRFQLHFAWPWQSDRSYREEDKRVGTIDDLPKGNKYNVLHADGNGRFLATATPQ